MMVQSPNRNEMLRSSSQSSVVFTPSTLRCTDSPREGYARRLSRALNVAKKMQVAIEEERPRISGAAFLPNQVFEKRSICSFLFDKTTRSIVILIVLVLCLGIVMLAAPNNVPANVIGGCFTLSGCYLVRRLLRHIRCYCARPPPWFSSLIQRGLATSSRAEP